MTSSWQVLKRISVVENQRKPCNEYGQGMLEYGMIIILVAILVMVLLLVLGPGTGNMFSNAAVNL